MADAIDRKPDEHEDTTIPPNEGTSKAEVTTNEEREVRVSSALQGLLDEHKAQSTVVQTLREDLSRLNENPTQFFENRKRFLFHAYTQTLKGCVNPPEFDVKVEPQLRSTKIRLMRVLQSQIKMWEWYLDIYITLIPTTPWMVCVTKKTNDRHFYLSESGDCRQRNFRTCSEMANPRYTPRGAFYTLDGHRKACIGRLY